MPDERNLKEHLERNKMKERKLQYKLGYINNHKPVVAVLAVVVVVFSAVAVFVALLCEVKLQSNYSQSSRLVTILRLFEPSKMNYCV